MESSQSATVAEPVHSERTLKDRWRAVPVWDFIVPVALAIAVRVALILALPEYAYEDAFITFRYAENLVQGHGFVYNIGERVLGTTTPLYTLILVALMMLGINVFTGAALFNLVCDIVLLTLLRQLLMKDITHPARRDIVAVTLLLVGLYFALVRVTVSRMETSLYLCLIIAALWAMSTQRHVLLGLLMGALMLTRPDGALLCVLIVGWLAWRNRAVPVAPVAVAGIVLAPYVLFSTAYFGSPLPQSVVAKSAVYPTALNISWFDSLDSMTYHVFIGRFYHRLLSLPFVILGLWKVIQLRSNAVLLLSSYAIAYFFAFVLSRTFIHEWYLAPLYLIFITLSGIGAGLILFRSLSFLSRSILIKRFLFAGIVVLLTISNSLIALNRIDDDYPADRVLYEIGMLLKERATPGAGVLLEPIGYVGYYSQLRIYDALGLVSPEAVTYFKEHGSSDYMVAWALDRAPEFAVLRPPELFRAAPELREAFLQRYEQLREFSFPERPDRHLIVFQRKQQ